MAATPASSVFGSAARDLVRELYATETLPAYNDEGVKRCLQELRAINKEIDDSSREADGKPTVPKLCGLVSLHTTAMRIKRCLIAYTHERLVRVETLRWEYGAVLPARWSSRLSRKEEDYSKAYGDALAEYMRSVDLDVTADVQPPRQLHVMVRVRRAIGEVVLASGQAVNMQPGTTLLLRRSDAEALVRRGALEEVDADA